MQKYERESYLLSVVNCFCRSFEIIIIAIGKIAPNEIIYIVAMNIRKSSRLRKGKRSIGQLIKPNYVYLDKLMLTIILTQTAWWEINVLLINLYWFVYQFWKQMPAVLLEASEELEFMKLSYHSTIICNRRTFFECFAHYQRI